MNAANDHFVRTIKWTIVASILGLPVRAVGLSPYLAFIRRGDWILFYVVFSFTIMTTSRQNGTRRYYALGLLFSNEGLFILHSAIGNTAHSRPLYSLDHYLACIPANTRRCLHVAVMLGQHRRRSANIT